MIQKYLKLIVNGQNYSGNYWKMYNYPRLKMNNKFSSGLATVPSSGYYPVERSVSMWLVAGKPRNAQPVWTLDLKLES